MDVFETSTLTLRARVQAPGTGGAVIVDFAFEQEGGAEIVGAQQLGLKNVTGDETTISVELPACAVDEASYTLAYTVAMGSEDPAPGAKSYTVWPRSHVLRATDDADQAVPGVAFDVVLAGAVIDRIRTGADGEVTYVPPQPGALEFRIIGPHSLVDPAAFAAQQGSLHDAVVQTDNAS